MENLVALTLRNKYGEEVYYLKSKTLDADFFVPETGTVYQAAYSLNENTDSRETDSLVKAAETIEEAKRFVVITYEEEETLEIGGTKIEVIPVWKWVLGM